MGKTSAILYSIVNVCPRFSNSHSIVLKCYVTPITNIFLGMTMLYPNHKSFPP